MPVEWIPHLIDMGSSDSVEVRSLDAHYLRPLFKSIFTEFSLSYGYLSRSSSHLQFPMRSHLLRLSHRGTKRCSFSLIRHLPHKKYQASETHVNGEVRADVERDRHCHGERDEARPLARREILDGVDGHRAEEEDAAEEEAVFGERREAVHAQDGHVPVRQGERRGVLRVRVAQYPVLKSCIKSEAVETMFIMTPQAAKPAKTPPCDLPAHAPIVKIASFPQSSSGNGGDCDVAAKREPGRDLVLEENLSSALIVERGSRVWVAGGWAVGHWDYAAGALFLELSRQGNQRSAQNFEEIVKNIVKVKGKGLEDIYMYPVTLDAMEAGVAGFSIPITFSVLDKRPHYTPRKNCSNIPVLSKNAVHVFTKKNPSSPADTLSEGMIPVVRLNFITITVNKTPNPRLTTKALIVNWFCHGGTSLSLKIISTDSTPPTSFFSPKPSSFNSSFLIIRSADPFSTLSPFVELSIFQLRAEL
nr:hypothetical protein ACMD2_05090 [Ipomoea batatas]